MTMRRGGNGGRGPRDVRSEVRMTRTSSLLDALYVTSSTRALRVTASEPHEKLPESRRSARNFMLPPRQRTGRTRGWLPLHSLVFAAGRPSSYLRVHARITRPPIRAGHGREVCVQGAQCVLDHHMYVPPACILQGVAVEPATRVLLKGFRGRLWCASGWRDA